MKRAQFSEEQIVWILKEHEAGREDGRAGPHLPDFSAVVLRPLPSRRTCSSSHTA